MRTRNIVIIVCLLILIVLIAGFWPVLSTLTGWVTKTGQLQIGNSAPVVDFLYINDSNVTDTATDVTINPVSNSSTAIKVKARITDLNGDCDTFTSSNGTAYLCNGTGSCTSTNADHTITLNYDSGDGLSGDGNRWCNVSGSLEVLQFYEINGTWRVNVTATDGLATDSNVRSWTYGELRSFLYAESGTVDMGSLTMYQWNNGTAGDQIKNAGNIILDLKWNATNFTGSTYSQKINITGTNYIIDDDTSGVDDTGNIAMVYIATPYTTQVFFNASSGLVRCSSVACTNENATHNIYWHMYVPAGLKVDTYTNTLQVESQDH